MSSSFSDPASSQNDSETNFIRGYIMEVEDEAVGSNPVDDNWITNYYEQRRFEEERLENLRSRLRGDIVCKPGEHSEYFWYFDQKDRLLATLSFCFPGRSFSF